MKLKLTVACVALAMEFGRAGTAQAQDMVVQTREPAEIAATWVANHEETVIGWMTAL